MTQYRKFMNRWTRKNWITTGLWGGGACFAAIFLVPQLFWIREFLVRTQTFNDQKWIVHALHQYHDDFGSFPPTVVRNADGNAMHSWRTIIQPYLASQVETSDDFTRYDLNLPWNSVTNVESIHGHRFGSHWYQFLAVVGPHAAWCEDRPRSMSEFTDGTADTILFIAMRNTGTQWHQPFDAVVGEDGTLTLNGKPLDTSVDMYVVAVDGTVHRTVDLDPVVLKALLTIDAGDEVSW